MEGEHHPEPYGNERSRYFARHPPRRDFENGKMKKGKDSITSVLKVSSPREYDYLIEEKG